MNTTTALTPVSNLDATARTGFVMRTYGHLAGAVGLFLVLETLLFRSGAARAIHNWLAGSSSMKWLAVLGGLMIVNWFAAQATADLANRGRQYGGLAAVVGGQALIFAPFLYAVFAADGAGTVGAAVAITVIGFAGLTAIAVTTGADLQRLRPLVMWGFFVALLTIVGATMFGANLGTWFSVAMIGLAGAAILYQTQTIMRSYPVNAHVSAATTLFSSLMTLFWYILRLLASRR